MLRLDFPPWAKVSIVFVDEFGIEEEGIDGGGIFKEYIGRLIAEVFNPDVGFFQITPVDGTFYPNSFGLGLASQFEFIGRMVGRAINENILLDVRFAEFFLRQWQNQPNHFIQIKELDPDLYQNLVRMLRWSSEEIDALALPFVLSDHELKSGGEIEIAGENEKITHSNFPEYLTAIAEFRLKQQNSQFAKAFVSGIHQILPPAFLGLFSSFELSWMVSGRESSSIDFEDFRKNVVYGGDYNEDHPTIKAFWRVVERDLTMSRRRSLVAFITGCPRPPLLGFSQLQPLIQIAPSGTEEETERLPTASTCINLLKLPRYPDETILRLKLSYAISIDTGFHLS